MSRSEYYIALFADDDPENLAARDQYPHIHCIHVSDTPIVVDLESGMYIRSKANTNGMQQMLDDLFSEDFGNDFIQFILPTFFNGDPDNIIGRGSETTLEGELTEGFAYLQEYVND